MQCHLPLRLDGLNTVHTRIHTYKDTHIFYNFLFLSCSESVLCMQHEYRQTTGRTLSNCSGTVCFVTEATSWPWLQYFIKLVLGGERVYSWLTAVLNHGCMLFSGITWRLGRLFGHHGSRPHRAGLLVRSQYVWLNPRGLVLSNFMLPWNLEK